MSEMGMSELVRDLGAMLMESADRFDGPGDLRRMIDIAAADLSRVRPNIVQGSLTLEADRSEYPAPAGIMWPVSLDWGLDAPMLRRPWNSNWLGRLPRLSVLTIAGVRTLMLTPAPTAHQIAELGADATYRYAAPHVVSETASETTVQPHDRHLLLIRAMAEAMQELANRGVTKPVTLGSGKCGGASVPKNGTPCGLADSLMALFERMAA